jgi:large subunit ribosomal protein L6|tara:strand:+ start:3453 stop:4004 length:552 start_codon:yes stop_codon:yes gene_type:complete
MTDKKNKGISIDVQFPEGVTSTLTESVLSLKGPNGELSRDFFSPLVKISLNGNILGLSTRSSKKNFKKMLNTTNAHINNMVRGVTDGFTYELKICSGHFPMTLKKEGEEVVISNFLGEKIPRRSKIVQGADLEIKGDLIIVKSPDTEKAGQTAANLEKATFIMKRDRRVFQDGCYIISKPAKK